MPKYNRVCLVCQKPFTSTYLNRCFTCSPSCRTIRNNRNRGGTLEHRFWSKVDKISSANGCWLWTRTSNQRGYGMFRLEGKDVPAHRMSYRMCKGEIPKGMFVCHKCDNPPCVNPEHLFIGTAKDNSDDMIRKGRRGYSPHSKHFLKETDIPLIKDYRNNGMIYKDIAEMFNVSDRTIGKVCRGERWKHVL